MEYKTIEELYTSLGVAGAIIVVFLGIFVYVIVQNDKRRSQEMKEIIEKLGDLKTNDTIFQNSMVNFSDAVKELSETVKIIANTVSSLDIYNKNIGKKLEKHDEKCDKILEEVRRL